ncbi:MAG: type IV pilin protein [Planctomycetota bacterium]|jgi:prepilin-type N-terminal cleavage/methylation domain-containing protein
MRKTRDGFTLVELAVVVVIIGVLAAFAVPRFLASIERSKAAEAFDYLAAIQASQERFHARQGTYASQLSELDLKRKVPESFSAATFEPGRTGTLHTSWSLTLTRTGGSDAHGGYTITFSQRGFEADGSTISERDNINPMQT